jgi:hypothetical protein
MKLRYVPLLLGCSAAIFATSVSADYTWVFSSSYSNCLGANATPNCNFGNTRGFSGSGSPSPVPGVTVQAWGDTGPNSSRLLETAYLPTWGGNGLGVQNRDLVEMPSPAPSGTSGGGDTVEGNSPEHSMDNNQRFDAMLFAFGAEVKLTGVSLGWTQTDSDITVLAYNGASPPLSGLAYSALTTNGWQVVGNYADVPVDKNTSDGGVSINGGGTSANYWLFLTYNPAFASYGCIDKNTTNGSEACDFPKNSDKTYGDDYVKLLALYGQKVTPPNGAPEPNVLLLLGVALGGFWATRRRQTRG